MNLVGKSYLAIKKYRSNLTSENIGSQEALSRKFLAEWEDFDQVDGEVLLNKILHYTSTQVPFYRHYFSENGQKNPARLTDWPILTRDVLRNEFANLHSETPPAGTSWTHASGGSTGKPVAVVHDEHFAAKAQALRMLCAKIFLGGPYYNKLILWGMSDELEKQKNGDASLKADVKNQLLQMAGLKTSHINTFNFTPEKLQECVHILNNQKPDTIFGYAGSVYQLAKYMHKHGIKPAHKLKIISTTAQTLYPFMRRQIENIFGCQVCDHYGSRELGPLAWQHQHGDMLFPQLFAKVEVVDDRGDPCAHGEKGRILVTGLHNFTMPLIRYEIGDSGVQGPDILYKGYPCSTLAKVVGKSNEEFTKKDGTLVHGQFFINLFYYRSWIDEFHVVQKQHELIEIHYVPQNKSIKPPREDIAEINARIRSVMTENCEILWREIKEIKPTKAGKRLYIRSEVA